MPEIPAPSIDQLISELGFNTANTAPVEAATVTAEVINAPTPAPTPINHAINADTALPVSLHPMSTDETQPFDARWLGGRMIGVAIRAGYAPSQLLTYARTDAPFTNCHSHLYYFHQPTDASMLDIPSAITMPCPGIRRGETRGQCLNPDGTIRTHRYSLRPSQSIAYLRGLGTRYQSRLTSADLVPIYFPADHCSFSLPERPADWADGIVFDRAAMDARPCELRVYRCGACGDWNLWHRRVFTGAIDQVPPADSIIGRCGACRCDQVFRQAVNTMNYCPPDGSSPVRTSVVHFGMAALDPPTRDTIIITCSAPQMRATDASLPEAEDTAATMLTRLTFGIEIECAIPYRQMDRHGWELGRPVPTAGLAEWRTKSDGSINCRDSQMPVEVVSPILRGPEGLAQVQQMVRQLQTMDARVNQSCGFHVHIGWTGNAAALRRLVCFVSNHEPALFAITGTRSRERNHYCASIKTAMRPFQNLRTLEDIARAHMSRYHTLNLTNIAAHLHGDGARQKRTVEFRVFAGTLNAVKIAAYVQLCLAMVQRALDSRQALPWDATLTRAQQTRAAKAPGQTAMARLLAQLNWYRDSDAIPFGVFDRDTTPALMTMMARMAKKYDAGEERDRSEREPA